jgi:CheY-like chemotaxis protein
MSDDLAADWLAALPGTAVILDRDGAVLWSSRPDPLTGHQPDDIARLRASVPTGGALGTAGSSAFALPGADGRIGLLLPSRPSSTCRRIVDVLVVDDHQIARQVTSGLVEHGGFRPLPVADGPAAIDMVMLGAVDAVLMDCMMPGMDGYAACSAIRAWEASQGTGRLPIVAVTADASEQVRSAALASGMDGVLVKPLVAEHLYDLLAHGSPVRRPTGHAFDGRQLALALRAFAGRTEMLWRQFHADTTTRLLAIAATADATAARPAIHALRGSAASLGAARLAEAAGKAEQAIADGIPADLTALAEVGRATLHDIGMLLAWRSGSRI